MTKKTIVSDFEISDYLDNDNLIIDFLMNALYSDDGKYFYEALGEVAKAKGITEISEKTGLNRQALYKTLSNEGNPRFETLEKVLDALGYGFVIKTKYEAMTAKAS